MREFTDRRAEYYEKAAELIAADPLGFYTRAERGREIQAAIKATDYETPKPAAIPPALEWICGKVIRLEARK